MIDLSAVLVNYNGGELLLRSLRALFASRLPPLCEVVLVDNASADGSVAAVREEFPDVRVIENATNRGFAAACNQGLRDVRAHHYLLLNPDTEVEKNAPEALWLFLKRTPGAGIVAPRLVYPDGRDQKTARRFPTPLAALFGRRSLVTRLSPGNRFSRRYMPAGQPTERAYPIDWVSGACLMIKDEVVEQIGGLDERFFMYWGDADWCFRARAAGWRTFTLPTVTVTHQEGASSGSRRNALVWEFHASVLHFYRKNYLRGSRGPRYWLAAGILRLRALALVTSNLIRSRADG